MFLNKHAYIKFFKQILILVFSSCSSQGYLQCQLDNESERLPSNAKLSQKLQRIDKMFRQIPSGGISEDPSFYHGHGLRDK